MNRFRLSQLCIAVAVLLAGRICLGQTPEKVDVDALVKTVNNLVKENADLKKRVADLEQRMTEKKEAPQPAAPAKSTEAPAPSRDVTPAEPPPGKMPLQTYWQEGLYLATPDEAFKLKIGGRVMVDVASFNNPRYWELGGTAIDETDGAEFREVRLELSGTMYSDYFYQLEVDFANDNVSIKDAYLGMHVPFLHALQVGHFTEPFRLEQLTTTNYTTFLERSMASEALAPYRALGMGFTAPFFDNRMTWAAGVFNRAVDDKPYWDFTTRLTGLPWYEDEGRRLLHLGASFLHQTPNGEIRFSSHPEAHQGNLHMDTGSFPAHTDDRWGVETALVVGPFSLQGEYMAAEADLKAPYRALTIIDVDKYFTSTRRFDGYYAQASYFITGENRPYNTETASFDRVIPRRNFTRALNGWGAWEVALRYSTINLDDYDFRSGVIGGKGENWTAGVNWYLTPNLRLMLNYGRARVNQLEYNGNLDIFQSRFQVDF